MSLSDETKKFHRDRYRDFFRDQNFRDRDFFSRPNIFETDTETLFRDQIFLRPIPRLFFETKSFRDRYWDFFWDQGFSRLIPRLLQKLKVKWRHKLKHLQNQETIATHWLFLEDQWELSAFTTFTTIMRSNPTHPRPAEAIAKVKK